jgi:maleate isomerase
MLNHDNWGWRARFGLFIVSCEAVPEAEWWAMLPPGTSVHASRVDASAPWANWNNDAQTSLTLADDLARGVSHFAAMRLNVVVIGHSSSSILGGHEWDNTVTKTLASQLPQDTQVTTNGVDCQTALRASGIQQPFIVFPPWFGDSLVKTGVDYFASAGFTPSGSLRADPGRQWRDIAPAELYARGMGFEQDIESLYRQIRSALPADADGVLIAGTGFRCVGIIEALEKDLHKPVVTANQASLWQCLRLSGVRPAISGYGKLLQNL